MKRTFWLLCAVVGLTFAAAETSAQEKQLPSSSRQTWGQLNSSGYQPWWNIFGQRSRNLTPEEERLQKFWHDHYDALRVYYANLDRIDWVAYYKDHGYQINSCGPNGCCRKVNFAPVFVNPGMQWAVPAKPPAPAPGPVPPLQAPGR
jgi:hypothetical protein